MNRHDIETIYSYCEIIRNYLRDRLRIWMKEMYSDAEAREVSTHKIDWLILYTDPIAH